MNSMKYLTTSERDALLATLHRYRHDERNSLMLEVLLRSGARAQELLNLCVSDLNDSEGTVFIRGLKGSRDREIPLPNPLYVRLKGYCQGDGKVFNISYNQLRNVWVMYRPVPKKLHSLRHTFAIDLYRRTKDIRLVQRALGHRFMSTTMIYQEYVYSIDEMKRAFGIE